MESQVLDLEYGEQALDPDSNRLSPPLMGAG